MKKALFSVIAAATMALAGCGASTLDQSASTDNTTGDTGTVSEDQMTGMVISGIGSEGEVMEEAGADINAKIAEVVSTKIEEEINAQLEDEEVQAELENAVDDGSSIAKDVRVGLGSRGVTLFIEDEEIPFAGGSMLLDGEVGLKLKFRPGMKIDVVASGELLSTLSNVERIGAIKEVPYALSLNGTNKMGLDGTFSVTLKSFKVSAMSAEIKSGIKESDVTATGTIAGRTVTGTVDMMDVALAIKNPDLLKNPGNFKVACSGNITTRVNDNIVASCKLAESCLSCTDVEEE